MAAYKVVVTGPESTGKTMLAKKLALHFDTQWIPEYAREYISSLGRSYRYSDIEHIAREQVRRERYYEKKVKGILFFDTHLIITKVWFRVVYQTCPEWIDMAIKGSGTDLFLVCATDIPWVPDPLRENGGAMRDVLLDMYIDEIRELGVPWEMVTGRGEKRIEKAVQAVKSSLNIQSL